MILLSLNCRPLSIRGETCLVPYKCASFICYISLPKIVQNTTSSFFLKSCDESKFVKPVRLLSSHKKSINSIEKHVRIIECLHSVDSCHGIFTANNILISSWICSTLKLSKSLSWCYHLPIKLSIEFLLTYTHQELPSFMIFSKLFREKYL